jgi:hypothetical protein
MTDLATFQPIRVHVACAPRRPVYFFLDFSNIAIAAGDLAAKLGDGVLSARRLRLHAKNLREFVERERLWQRGYAAAGFNSVPSGLCRNFGEAGIHFDAHELGCLSRREQGIDEAIQGEMRKLLPRRVERGIVALATGDGNGHRRGEGFLPALQDLHEEGFSIELMSWRDSCNPTLQNWASSYGTVVELDDWFHELTFINGGRSAERLRPNFWERRR